MHLLCFTLADKEYAVNIDSVREVRRVKSVTPVPQALDFIEGVMSLRGKVIPIINLRKKMGLPAVKETSLNRVIISESDLHVLGIAVDGVVGVVAVDEADIEPPDDVLKKAEYLTGVGKIGKRLILIADIRRLLSSEEKSGIAEVHKKVELKRRGR